MNRLNGIGNQSTAGTVLFSLFPSSLTHMQIDQIAKHFSKYIGTQKHTHTLTLLVWMCVIPLRIHTFIRFLCIFFIFMDLRRLTYIVCVLCEFTWCVSPSKLRAIQFRTIRLLNFEFNQLNPIYLISYIFENYTLRILNKKKIIYFIHLYHLWSICLLDIWILSDLLSERLFYSSFFSTSFLFIRIAHKLPYTIYKLVYVMCVLERWIIELELHSVTKRFAIILDSCWEQLYCITSRQLSSSL